MTGEERGDYLRHALTWGAISGGLLILYFAILYACGDHDLQIGGIVPYCILSYTIYYCQLGWKKRRQDIGYGGLLLIGLVCGFAASLFVDLYTGVYIKMLNPSYMDGSMQESINQSIELYRSNKIFSESELEQAQSLMQRMMTPMLMISSTIWYTIISLMLSAFSAFLINMKKIQ